MPRKAYLTADDIAKRSLTLGELALRASPVMVEIRRLEQQERAGNVHFLLRLLGAVATVGCILFFTFYYFGGR